LPFVDTLRGVNNVVAPHTLHNAHHVTPLEISPLHSRPAGADDRDGTRFADNHTVPRVAGSVIPRRKLPDAVQQLRVARP
jgi:hypothetical protein